jgi:hypothetical protein
MHGFMNSSNKECGFWDASFARNEYHEEKIIEIQRIIEADYRNIISQRICAASLITDLGMLLSAFSLGFLVSVLHRLDPQFF